MTVLASSWRTISGAAGRFSLELPDGTWEIEISQPGYYGDTLVVRVAGAAVEVGVVQLSAAPIELRALTVRAPDDGVLRDEVTGRTLENVPPLGGPDVFRALVLLPTVSQPNDLKGSIHLAGGATDETGVWLDGHPLQAPFHLLGLIGAVDVAALGGASVDAYAVPMDRRGWLSGAVEMRSAPPTDASTNRASLGLLSSGITTNRPLPGDADLLASARVSYLDKLEGLLGFGLPRLGFGDAILRIGRSAGDWRIEALGYATRDVFAESGLTSIETYRPLTWGEELVGFRVVRETTNWEATTNVSIGRAHVDLDERGAQRGNRVRSRSGLARASLKLARRWRRASLSGGLFGERRSYRHDWTAVHLADEIFTPHTPGIYDGGGKGDLAGAWGEAKWWPVAKTNLRAGARWIEWRGRSFVAPAVGLRQRFGGAAVAELSFERRLQVDTQLEEPIEGSIRAPRFLLDRPRRADVLAAGVELEGRRVGNATMKLGATLFGKRYPDLPVLSGDTTSGVFPQFDRVPGRAGGAAASLRLESGSAWLLEGSYTYQRSQYREGQTWVAQSWDLPHQVKVFGTTPFLWGTTLNVAFAAHSGRATTPVTGVVYAPRQEPLYTLEPRYIYGPVNSLRLPGYSRLDAAVRKQWSARGARLTAAFQVLNVLNQSNPIDYDWGSYFSRVGDGRNDPGRGGLPVLPTAWFEVEW